MTRLRLSRCRPAALFTGKQHTAIPIAASEATPPHSFAQAARALVARCRSCFWFNQFAIDTAHAFPFQECVSRRLLVFAQAALFSRGLVRARAPDIPLAVPRAGTRIRASAGRSIYLALALLRGRAALMVNTQSKACLAKFPHAVLLSALPKPPGRSSPIPTSASACPASWPSWTQRGCFFAPLRRWICFPYTAPSPFITLTTKDGEYDNIHLP
jgi:hypothetical protein